MQFSDLKFASTGVYVPENFPDFESRFPFIDDNEGRSEGGVCVVSGAIVNHGLPVGLGTGETGLCIRLSLAITTR